MTGLDFDKNGYLAAGIHEMAQPDLEANFVTAFPYSSTRSEIIAGYNRHAAEIVALVGRCEQFLDGSFVTNKNDPGDVDLVIFVDASVLDALDAAKRDAFRALVNGKETRKTRMCDAYICPVYPDGHANADASRQSRKYWMGEFGFDRSDVPKGIVRVTLP
jgi:hypothetical protein